MRAHRRSTCHKVVHIQQQTSTPRERLSRAHTSKHNKDTHTHTVSDLPHGSRAVKSMKKYRSKVSQPRCAGIPTQMTWRTTQSPRSSRQRIFRPQIQCSVGEGGT